MRMLKDLITCSESIAKILVQARIMKITAKENDTNDILQTFR